MNTTETSSLPTSVAYSHDMNSELLTWGCKSPEDFTILDMPGGYGDCIVLHSQKALEIWQSLPKNHPDKCAHGYGAGTGMYIRE